MMAPPGAAQPGPASRPDESAAGVCAFGAMPPLERIETCRDFLRISGLSSQARAIGLLGLAEGLRLSGDPAASISPIDEAIRLFPSMSPAYLSRGSAHLALGDLDAALADASQALEIDRRNPAGFLLRAEAYLRQGAPAFALGDLDEAVDIAPNVARIRLVRAYANMALEKIDAALADARLALKLEPELAPAYLIRSRLYMSTGAFARAAADAGRAVDLAPEDRQANDAAAIAYTEVARFELAEQAADKLVALAPADADALNARCWIRALKPDPKGALPDCDAAIAANPAHFQARDSRAFALWQLGRLEDARAELAVAEKLDPDFWDWSKREERFLTVMIRRYLKSLGRYRGPLDGDFEDPGPTSAAIRAYQADAGLQQTGAPSRDLMAQLASDYADRN